MPCMPTLHAHQRQRSEQQPFLQPSEATTACGFLLMAQSRGPRNKTQLFFVCVLKTHCHSLARKMKGSTGDWLGHRVGVMEHTAQGPSFTGIFKEDADSF